MKRSFLLFLSCFSFLLAHGQEDVLFWFAVPDVSESVPLDLDRPIFLRMTAYAAPATVTISQPAGGGMPTAVITIPANSTMSFDLTTWINLLETTPANTVLNYGVEIQSTAPISAYYDVVGGPSCLCNPEDFVLKGNNALGTDFWIPGQDTLENWPSYSPIPTNSFDIVATQNGTTVTITPSHDIVGHLAGTTFTVAMNAGQTYSATAASNLGPNHLCGSRVTSDKPIAITEKDDLLNYVSGGVSGQDLIGDQIVPVPVLGTEYIPMYGDLSPPGDKVFITGTHAGTVISYNGVPITTIGAGQTFGADVGMPSCYIQATYPVYVYHLSGIGSEVGSALLPQINCTGSTSVSLQQSSTINFKINLLVKAAGIGGFLVNGTAGVVTPAMFTAVPATGGVWYSAQVTLPVATYPIGSVLTVSNPGYLFQLGYLSSGPPNSGADFGYFSNYGGINPNPTTTNPNICVGDSINLFAETIDSATYLWSGPGGFTSTLQNPFVAPSAAVDSGVYKITVNTPGCMDSGQVTIAVHPYPAVNIGNDTTICSALPYTLKNLDNNYSSDISLWSTGAATDSIIVTTTGVYYLTVSNDVCNKTDTVSVSLVPLVAPTVLPATYCQDATTAVPVVAGGTGLLWYTAATGGTGSTVAPTPSTLVPGVITYYVSSTLGICESARAPLTVTINPLPLPPLMSDPNPYCQGQAFIPITVSGMGVLWYPGATGGAGSTVVPTVNTAVPGTYTFFASQTVNGCEGPRGSISITVLDTIKPSFTYAIHYGCHGDTVMFTNTSTGATRYSWYFGDGHSDTVTSPRYIYHTQDSFHVKLFAINTQCDDSAMQTITLIHPLVAAFSLSPSILCQDSLVTFVNSSVGTGLTYKWYFGNGVTSSAFNTTYAYKNSGVYNVQLVATDFVPCHDTATAVVYVDSTTGIGITVTDSVLCNSTYVTLTGDYTTIGNTNVTWNFGDGDSITQVNPVKHAYQAAGTYIVTVTPHYRACRDTSISKAITVFAAPEVNLGPDTSICPGSEAITLTDNINAANAKATWLWSTGQTTPGISVVAPGYYFVAVGINGCYASDTVLVQNDCYLNIPNVFTPNGDGLNDYFFPRQFLAKGLTSFKMNIYNRWGQLIFETNSLDGAGWDGKLNNVDQPEGVYVYVMDATFKDGQKEHRQGNVTLLR